MRSGIPYIAIVFLGIALLLTNLANMTKDRSIQEWQDLARDQDQVIKDLRYIDSLHMVVIEVYRTESEQCRAVLMAYRKFVQANTR